MRSYISELEARLVEVGVSLGELFGRTSKAFRRVEAVSQTHVSLDFDGRAVALPSCLFPPVEVNQWLRFERTPNGLRVRVDFGATLQAETRFTSLLMSLSGV